MPSPAEQEQIDILNAAAAQQLKTEGEIRAIQAASAANLVTIATLEAALANAGSPSLEMVAAVKAVKDGAQALDDLIPDVPPAP